MTNWTLKSVIAPCLLAGIFLSVAGGAAAHPVDRVVPESGKKFPLKSSPGDKLTLDRFAGSADHIEICLKAKNGITWRKTMHIYAGPDRIIKTLETVDSRTSDCTKIRTDEFAPRHARFELVKAGMFGVNTETLYSGRFNVHAYDGMGFTINWLKD